MGIVTDQEILRLYCRTVKKGEAVSHITRALLAGLKEYNGAGLAANQLGWQVRIFAMVYDTLTNIIIINPVITRERGSQRGIEGCLSLPGVKCDIKRPNIVTVNGLDQFEEPVRYRFHGQQARIACHEIDHLDGKLMIDYGVPLSPFHDLIKERVL